MSLKGMKAFLSFRVPDLDQVVVGATDNQFAVILNATHRSQVTNENVQTFTGIDLPDSQGSVPAAAHHLVSMQVHTTHRWRVTVQRMDAMTRLGVPYFQSAIGTATDDSCACHLGRPYTTCVTYERS